MIIGLTYDLKEEYVVQQGEPEDDYAEFDSPETINEIKSALEQGGHQVVCIGNLKTLLQSLAVNDVKVDIIFNIAEGIKGRNRESQIPALLEAYQIPYVGSDALTLGLTLDKAMAKKIFIYHGLPTPPFILASHPEEVYDCSLSFPVIVKPCFEGTSKGLTPAALVRDVKQLKKRVQWLTETYRQPALVEEFISGQEFTVAVIGNEQPMVLPPVQVAIQDKIDLGDDFYTRQRVEAREIRDICPADITRDLEEELKRIAREGYEAVGCRDLGRLDFRVNKAGQPFLLEINPLPSLSKMDVFPLVSKAIGMDYNGIINQIFDFATQRQNISQFVVK